MLSDVEATSASPRSWERTRFFGTTEPADATVDEALGLHRFRDLPLHRQLRGGVPPLSSCIGTRDTSSGTVLRTYSSNCKEFDTLHSCFRLPRYFIVWQRFAIG